VQGGGLLSETTRPRGGAGVDHRPVLNGIVRVLRLGAPWHRVPLVRTKPAISSRDLNPVKVQVHSIKTAWCRRLATFRDEGVLPLHLATEQRARACNLFSFHLFTLSLPWRIDVLLSIEATSA
jgi:transposase